MIFISGPVAVFPSSTIAFQTCLPSHERFSNPQWLKMKNNFVKEIKADTKKYFIMRSTGLSFSERLDIAAAGEGDSATYQLSFWQHEKQQDQNLCRWYVHIKSMIITFKLVSE